MRRFDRPIAVASATVALSLAAASLGPAVIAQTSQTFDEVSALLANERNTIDVIDRAGDSVVAVNVALPADAGSPFGRFFAEDEAIPQGSGSGFLIAYEDDPFLVTNYHVVEGALQPASADFLDGAEISVTFPSDEDPVRDRKSTRLNSSH